MQVIEPQLRKKIGIIHRLTWKLPKSLTISLIEPLFMSKLRYGLSLIVNLRDHEKDKVLKCLHSLHRQVMKASLKMPKHTDISTEELLRQTGQQSIYNIAFNSAATLAWKLLPSWETQPLTAGRVVKHLGIKSTRQHTQHNFPPQQVDKSLITTLVHTWELLPQEIKQEESITSMKRSLNTWIRDQSF